MPQFSPTAEGFRTAFRFPSLSFAEIAWRWSVGATATAVFFFGFFEFLSTLPVSRAERLFLTTRHPYLVGQAMAHILRGSLNRAVGAGLLAALMIILLWMIAGAIGRLTTVRWLLDYFRGRYSASNASDTSEYAGKAAAELPTLLRLNFLRAVVGVAVLCGLLGAAVVADILSPGSAPQPGLAFLFFVLIGAVVCFLGWFFNWFLSLAALFSVRNGTDAIASISTAASFCRDYTSAIFAVSTWTGLAHLVVFVGATIAVSMPLALAGALPGRLVILTIAIVTLIYFLIADWLYIARLAGYVCIAEMPEATPEPIPAPILPPAPVALQTTIDKNEVILSDRASPLEEM
jgi:hypothetical protein